MTDLRFGIDLGGSKIEAAALDGAGRIVWHGRDKTSPHSYQDTLANIAQLAAAGWQATGFTGVRKLGIGIPGVFNQHTGKMEGASLGYLNDKPLADDLRDILKAEIRIANDANCFALSEAHDGSAAGLAVVVGVIIGTGYGAGVVVNNRIISGAHGIAGEIGHWHLPWQTRDEMDMAMQVISNNEIACACGNAGCVESFLSGPAISREYQQASGVYLSVEEIAECADQDTHAEAVLTQFEHRLARTLAMVINILDPDAIVLGGGLSNLTRLYKAMPSLLPPYVYTQRAVATRILPPKYGAASGVRGAAWLWE
ncbi:MAG: ROK family protein [Proteobacteria bacterium]|nr:ROK family protein [Pseudomonadota bacterium]